MGRHHHELCARPDLAYRNLELFIDRAVRNDSCTSKLKRVIAPAYLSTGVLAAKLTSDGIIDRFLQWRGFIEVEAHVATRFPDPPEALGKSRRHARLEHIVLRLDYPRCNELDPSFPDKIAVLDELMTRFPHLRTVTLETIDERESMVMASQLPLLSNSGKLRRRTCKESQKVVQEARNNRGLMEDGCVVSSMLHSVRTQTLGWYVNVLPAYVCQGHLTNRMRTQAMPQ